MFKLLISVRAQKKINLIKRTYQEAILAALEEIKEDPFIGKSLTRELSGQFSYRVGSYRITYRIRRKDKVVYIMTAGHRSSVYR